MNSTSALETSTQVVWPESSGMGTSRRVEPPV
jgi:hypothetical protein